MLKAKVYDLSLFLIALVIAFSSAGILTSQSDFLKALSLYWLFSALYYHLRIFSKNGSTSIDYGISYDLSFVMFTGPFGLFIFEAVYRFTVYFYRKWTKTADPTEFTDTFYNIGVFVITNSIAYFLFQYFYNSFQSIPFGFWILLFLLTCLSSYLSRTFMVIVFKIMGDLKSFKEASNFILKSVSLLDYGKAALSNGFLFLFLQNGQWELLIVLFLLNYIVSRSFHSKQQSIQNKLERDKFEQMAYTDFLTGAYNRTYMDQIMAEFNKREERIGIVVADIDYFKQINDSYNHAVGDKVIQHFAATLKKFLSQDDYLFRSGGEEFTIYLRKRNFEETLDLVRMMRDEIRNNSVLAEYGGGEITVGCTGSFGLYYDKITELSSMEKAYVQADELLIKSKQLGKNKVSAQKAQSDKKVV